MPAYQIDVDGKSYRVDAENPDELPGIVETLKKRHADTRTEATLEKSVEEAPRTRGWFKDVGAAALRGPLKAIKAAAELLPESWDYRINIGNGRDFIEKPQSPFEKLIVPRQPDSIGNSIDALGKPETKTGAITEGISQFAAGMLPTTRVLQGLNVLQGGARATTALRGLTAGAATSGVFFDGQEANLANLVEMAPVLQNPVTEFLATSESTPELEGRLKNALTDAVGGALVEGAFLLIKGVKAGRALRAPKEPEAPAPANTEVAPAAPPEAPAPDAVAKPLTADPPDVVPETPKSTVEALERKEPGYAELSEEQAVARLSQRLGITGEKLAEIRQALQRGVPGEDLEKIIDLNPGYIDWSNVRSAEDVVALMNTVTRTLGDEVAQKAGYARQSVEWVEEQAAKLADETGGGYNDAVGIFERVKNLPATVVLQRKLVTASATHLRDLAQKIRKGTNTPTELIEFITHERRHALLQVTARGTRAAVGRALRMMQEGVSVSEASMKLANARHMREARKAAEAAGEGAAKVEVPKQGLTADEAAEALKRSGMDEAKVRKLADYIADSADLEELNRVNRMSLRDKIEDVLSTLYINNILSGIPTLAVNATSGVYKMAEAVAEQYGAAAVSFARGGDKWERVVANKSTIAMFSSMRSALAIAAKAWKEGLPQTDIIGRHEVLQRGGLPSSLAGKAITLPSRAIVTIDEFFKHVFYQQELTARAVEVAAAAARTKGGKAAQEAEFKRVFNETMQSPPDDLVLDAIEKARYQTFQNDPQSRLVTGLTGLTNSVPPLRLVLPFIKTPYNIIAQSVERTPLALLSSNVRRTLAGEMGKRAQGEMATRVFVGSAAVATAWQLADSGQITGSKVGGKGNRNTADLSGAPPYSVKIGDSWYQYNRFDPMGTALGLVADLRLYYNARNDRLDNETTVDDPEAGEAMGAVLAVMTENLADKAFLKGLSDLFDAIGSVRDGGSASFMETYVANLAINFVPYSSLQRQFARSGDEVSREAWTVMDKLRAQTPGFSDSLPPKRDVLGREVHHMDRVGADWMSPFGVGKEDQDPVAKALVDLELTYRMPNKDIAGVKLDPAAYSRMLELRGKDVYEAVNERLNDGEWAALTKFQRTDLMRRLFSTASSRAEAQVLEENPMLAAAVEAHREELALVKSGEIE